jgi:hypothetical protein
LHPHPDLPAVRRSGQPTRSDAAIRLSPAPANLS